MNHFHARYLTHDEKFAGVFTAQEALIGDILIMELITLIIHVPALHAYLLIINLPQKTFSSKIGTKDTRSGISGVNSKRVFP
jgi:hypothetical protein